MKPKNRLKYAYMKPKGKSKWSPPKKNKAAATRTKRTRLEYKAAEILRKQ